MTETFENQTFHFKNPKIVPHCVQAGLSYKNLMPIVSEACCTSLRGWHVHSDYLAVGWNRQFSRDDAAAHGPRSSRDVERLPRRGGATRRHGHNRTCGDCKTQVWSPP